MVHTVNDRKFSFSYCELREHYERLCNLSDEAFLVSLPEALHLACIVGWLKELGPEATIGEVGIVHELVHLLHSGTTTPLEEIRSNFCLLLKLA